MVVYTNKYWFTCPYNSFLDDYDEIYFWRCKFSSFNFAKSKAKLFLENKPKITFNDVAGLEEVKEDLQEEIEFLRNPKKFSSIGAKIPKGVLLVGPPGCE